MKRVLTNLSYCGGMLAFFWVLSSEFGLVKGGLIFACTFGGASLYAVGNHHGFNHGLRVGEARWRDGRERWNGQDD
jgi:hypothetical protein